MFSRKEILPFKDQESVPLIIGISRHRSFQVMYLQEQQLLSHYTSNRNVHPPPCLGHNVPSFGLMLVRGRDMQHVQLVNTFNETRRSQGKVKAQYTEAAL